MIIWWAERGGVTECPLRYKYVGGWTKSANQSAEHLDSLLGLLRYTRRWGSGRTGLSSLHYSSPAHCRSNLLLFLQVLGKRANKGSSPYQLSG